MGFGDDEDILQDFLVEAGEILEQLSEQLVELEQSPDDRDLLNAIFRGFHTVKGGAGFLQLDPMVECCHVTENLFDILRNGKRSVTPELMDVVLSALDAINAQFQQIQQFEKPEAASPDLIASLERLVNCEDIGESDEVAETSDSEPESTPVAGAASATPEPSGVADHEITDEEFEDLLDAIDPKNTDLDKPAETSAVETPAEVMATSTSSDEITEDEFDALLDQLHGKGKGPGVDDTAGNSNSPAEETASPVASTAGSSSGSDEITEDEFEALLDQLHGKGNAPKPDASSTTAPATESKAESPAPSTTAGSSGGDELITEDEFEALLDQLHGKGQKPSTSGKTETSANKPSPEKAAAAPSGKAQEPPASAPKSESSAAKKPEPKKPEAKPSTASAAKPAPSAAAKPAAALKPKDSPQANIAATETTVRVDTQRLDDIMNMVGELVLVRNRLVRLGVDSTDEALSKAVANLDVVTADLQSSVMKTRMQPIKKVFGRFPRVVRDLARNLKKEINLELQGEDTDLDKNLVEALADPLVHLVRNAVDHGIEAPAVREESGKSRVGKVVLAAEQEGDHILLSITDDGAGMDPDALRQKAVEKGIYDEDTVARLSDSEAFDLIFAPGFSTKTEISDVSGRGVGMDVVKTKITQLNGSIEITSKKGEGSRIIIKVPLTLAIMPTLMIMLSEQTFALPLVSVNEIFHMDLTKANIVDGQECVTIRDRAIPIFHLKRWLVHKHSTQPDPKSAHVVIVSVGTQRVGFVVDQLIGQEEVVIKPLGKMLHGTPGMAGATITGDGTIALILDVPSMLKRYAQSGL
ncbi:chemotaxis protein CheA [Aurantivibrio plasticivorans]